MGRLLAVTLAQAGCEVELFEAGGPEAEGAAARVAAAMLAPLAESAVAPASVVRMGHYALDRWPTLIASLAAPVFFQREGTLVLWHRQDASEAARLARVLARTGEVVPELPAMKSLDAAAGAGQRHGQQAAHEPGAEDCGRRERKCAARGHRHILLQGPRWRGP